MDLQVKYLKFTYAQPNDTNLYIKSLSNAIQLRAAQS